MKTLCLLLSLIIGQYTSAQDWSPKQAPLMTRWASRVDKDAPLPEYPRPQMVRKDWVNLNGLWEYQPGKENDSVPAGRTLKAKILVPYPVESALSGVMEHHERIWYRKNFNIPVKWKNKRVIVHFGAIDWESEIFINGKSLGIHKGGYDEISHDITPYIIAGKQQELIVRVYDPTENYGQPRGKQENPPHEILIMYTPVTGIWQTVWMEPVEQCSISQIKIIPDVDRNLLRLKVDTVGKAAGASLFIEVKIGDKVISKLGGKPGTELSIPIRNVKLWSPESPFLYDLTIELRAGKSTADIVSSYFGMRKISVAQVGDHKKIMLNNKFVYNLGFLDQGFWPDGVYTAPTDEALKYDIQVQKDLGYNMVRKHIKVEPQRWYYWADKLGIMVWQDMPSPSSYRKNAVPPDTTQCRIELERMIEGRFNSPSIICWVLFNETQGQKSADGTNLTPRIVGIVRSKDPDRLINAASDNIYKDFIGDILDYHSYPGPKIIESKDMATACGEFGSLGLSVPGHEWVAGKGVSALMLKSATELEDTYEKYIMSLLDFKLANGMSGAVFTQITDVEQEVNGFLTYDRVLKIDVPRIKAINRKLISQDRK